MAKGKNFRLPLLDASLPIENGRISLTKMSTIFSIEKGANTFTTISVIFVLPN